MAILTAMSGGVDSTIAAWTMKQTGVECHAGLMSLYGEKIPEGAELVRALADRLGMPFHLLDFHDEFLRHVINPFVNTYLEGKTPNPCVSCNRHIKFGKLLQHAKTLGCDTLATGHYAQIEYDPAAHRFLLKKAADITKDQSYVLYSLSQEQLASIRFPLGTCYKTDVRQQAAELGLINADKHDSQDLCFVPDGDYAGFIERHTRRQSPAGNFVNKDGKVLGQHKGIIRYTIGQRKGLGIAAPAPYYVCGYNIAENMVILGSESDLRVRTVTASEMNLIPFDSLEKPIRCLVKVRYRQKGDFATVMQTGEKELRIDFDEPPKGVALGQSAVLYDGDYILGGGTITATELSKCL